MRSHGQKRSGSLPAENRRRVAESHFALIAGRGVASYLVAGTDWARKDWRGVAEPHLALILRRGAASYLVAGTDRTRSEFGHRESPVDGKSPICDCPHSV